MIIIDYLITLKCFNCGESKDIIVNNRPIFASDIYDIANQSGFYGVIDLNNKRALVFCNEDCANKHKTKKGTYKIKAGYRD